MQKLKLDLDALQVVGFATAADDDAREGTVLANAATRACTLGSCGQICP